MRRSSSLVSSFVLFTFLVSLLFALRSDLSAQDFRTVHPGVEHAQVDHRIGTDPVKINLLRLDPQKVRLDVHHANDKALGLETTSSIATRHRAVAAINAGFFRLDRSEFAGDAAGVLMIDGELLSESVNTRSAVSIQNLRSRTIVLFNRVSAYLTVQLGDRGSMHQYQISGTNRELKKDEVVIYSPSFGPSTLTKETRYEILLTRCRTGRMIGSFRDIVCKRMQIVPGSINAKIPADGYVMSMGSSYVPPDQFDLSSQIDRIARDMQQHREIRIRKPVLLDGAQFTTDGSVDITNGVSRLVQDGKLKLTWEDEKASKSFAETRHPRTAIAWLRDGRLLMLTVDGRQPGISVGMSLRELAEYLISIGATEAMNLDGGGSTTMFLNGKVINTPSDKEGERKVGDAIVVTLRGRSRK